MKKDHHHARSEAPGFLLFLTHFAIAHIFFLRTDHTRQKPQTTKTVSVVTLNLHQVLLFYSKKVESKLKLNYFEATLAGYILHT